MKTLKIFILILLILALSSAKQDQSRKPGVQQIAATPGTEQPDDPQSEDVLPPRNRKQSS